MSFTADTSDLKAAAAVLRGQTDAIADPILAATVDDLADSGLAAVKRGASRHVRTGRMLDQVRVVRKGSGADHTARIVAGGPIAAIVVGGSVAHDIRPRRAAALGPMSGSVRPFARRVRHPGTRPDSFVDRAFEDLTHQADAAAQDAVDQVAKGLAAAIDRRT